VWKRNRFVEGFGAYYVLSVSVRHKRQQTCSNYLEIGNISIKWDGEGTPTFQIVAQRSWMQSVYLKMMK
jgi:hypothetical protein